MEKWREAGPAAQRWFPFPAGFFSQQVISSLLANQGLLECSSLSSLTSARDIFLAIGTKAIGWQWGSTWLGVK